MRVVYSPLHGTVRAAERKDLPALRSFAAILQAKWHADIISRFDQNQCAGEYAPFAEIAIYSTGSRDVTTRVERVGLLRPGICHGSALWEPMVQELLATLQARGVDCSYERGLSDAMLPAELCRHASAEVAALRAKRSGQ